MKRLIIPISLLVCCLLLPTKAEELPQCKLTYLYVPACQSCAKVAAVLDSLCDEIDLVIADGKVIRSRLLIERIDISANPARAESLFSQYGTPQADQIVPSVYLDHSYLAGSASILTSLEGALRRGEALVTGPEFSGGQAPEQAVSLSLGASIGAGLIAGFNPCALSMLILLLSSILHLGRRTKLLAAIFLLTKLFTYFFIGLALLSVLQAWNPAWLTTGVKILLSVAAGFLIIVNLLDAARAGSGDYGRIRNQLPLQLRQMLRGLIKRMAESPYLVGGMLLLGIAISIGEFLCAGQLYLATLLSSINSGSRDIQRLIMLASYCIAFILPSVAVTLIVLRLKHTLEVSDFIRRRLPLIKVLTAMVLLISVVFAWLI